MIVESVLLFSVGLLALVVTADRTISHALQVSRLTGLTELAVGFILLTIGTTMPELAVSVMAAIQGQPQIILGTTLGSNISNITLILGLSVLIGGAIYIRKKDVPVVGILILSSILGIVLILLSEASQLYGILGLGTFLVFVWIVMKEKYTINSRQKKDYAKIAQNIAALTASIGGVLLAANILVNSSIEIARLIFIPELFISGTFIAVGTSLPELAVAVAAIRRGRSYLTVGNLSGSLLANIGMIIGLVAIVTPFALNFSDIIWIASMLIANMIFAVVLLRKRLRRFGALLLIVAYILIIWMLMWMN